MRKANNCKSNLFAALECSVAIILTRWEKTLGSRVEVLSEPVWDLQPLCMVGQQHERSDWPRETGLRADTGARSWSLLHTERTAAFGSH